MKLKKQPVQKMHKIAHGKLLFVVSGNSLQKWDALWEDRLLVAVMAMPMN